jgi:hypothetical protein
MTNEELDTICDAADRAGEYRGWYPAWIRYARTVALQEIDQRWQDWLTYAPWRIKHIPGAIRA